MNIYKRASTPGRTQSKSNQSRSFEERRKRRIILGVIAASTALASWIFVFYSVSFLPSLELTSVHVYGAEADITPLLRAAAYRSIQGSYFGLFSKANAFMYPENSIVAAVGAAAPRINSVTVKREGLHDLTIAVSEKNPAAVACVGLPNFDNNGVLLPDDPSQADTACYFTDDSGFMFRKTTLAIPDTYIRYYMPVISDDPIGHYATSTETFRALQEFVKSARTNGIAAEALLIKPAGEYELYARNPGGKNLAAPVATAVIYLNDSAGFPTELSNLSAFWNNMIAGARIKDAPLNFEYIDVRYGSNVFYRLIQ